MGVKCQIYRNEETLQVEKVTDSNGNPSKLYAEALEMTNDPKKALNIWATAYTDNYPRKEKGDISVTLSDSTNPSFEEGSRLEITTPGGYLEIGKVKGASLHSILELKVDEGVRRRGIASKLLKQALDKTEGEISGMASNDASVELNYKLGMRAYKDGEELTLEESKSERAKNAGESIRMHLPFNRQGDQYQKFGEVLEPSLQEVLTYIEMEGAKEMSLGIDELSDIKNNLENTNINTLQDLHVEMKSTFFDNGQMIFNESKLSESQLYTPSEVIMIMTNSEAQSQIKETYDKLTGHLLQGKDIEVVNENLSKEIADDRFTVVDNTQVTGIGKFKTLPTAEVDLTLAATLAGTTSMTDFISKVKTLPYNNIINNILNSEGSLNKYYDIYSKLTPVPSLKLENGELKFRKNNEVESKSLRSVVVGKSADSIRDNAEFIKAVPVEVWSEYGADVTSVLTDIEVDMANIGIDVVGLKDKYMSMSQAEVVSMVDSLLGFSESAEMNLLTAEDITSMSNFIEENILPFNEDKNTYKVLSEANRERAIFHFPTRFNEATIFDTNSLLRVGEDLYQKINRKPLEVVYDEVYNMVLDDNSILPDEAYYPYAFNEDGTLDIEYLNDVDNSSVIKKSIKNYFQEKASQLDLLPSKGEDGVLEEIAIYKELFNHAPMVEENPVVEEELVQFQNFDGDPEYLESQFISDFSQLIIKEKAKDSNLYNRALKYLEISERGITLETTDENVKKEIRLRTKDNKIMEDFKNYTILSRDKSVKDIYEFEDTFNTSFINADNFERIYYINNSTAAPIYKGDYAVKGDNIVVDGTLDKFVRTLDGLFERIQKHEGRSYYTRLPEAVGNYNLIQDITIDTDVDAILIDNLGEEIEGVTITPISKSELERINKEIDECS